MRTILPIMAIAFFYLNFQAKAAEVEFKNFDFMLRMESGNRTEYSPKGNSSLSGRFLGDIAITDNKVKLKLTPRITTKMDQPTDVDAHELYIDYQLANHYAIKLGRQVMSYHNGRLLSENRWSLAPQSYDTLKLYTTNFKYYSLHLFYTPLKNDSLEYLDYAPTYQAGLSQKVKYQDFQTELTLFYRKTVSNGAPNFTVTRPRNEWTLAFSSNINSDTLCLEVNHLHQIYDLTFVKGRQMAYSQNLDLGYQFRGIPYISSILPKVTFFKTHELYLDTLGKNHGELGALDLWSKRNIKGYGFINDLYINKSNIFKFKILSLYRLDTNDDLSDFDNIKFDTQRISNASHIGIEKNIAFEKRLQEKLRASIEFAHLTPKDYLKDLYGEEQYYKIYFEVGYEF